MWVRYRGDKIPPQSEIKFISAMACESPKKRLKISHGDESSTENNLFVCSAFCLPQRIVLAVMIFLGFMCEYMMRNVLSIAITEIAKKTFTNDSIDLGEICPFDDEPLPDDDDNGPGGTYDWSEARQGVILSSFYWGYIITHIPGGMLVEKFGGKTTMLAGIAATSVLTLLTPLSITLGDSTLLIINRIVMGLCQGFLYAAVFGLLATWIPLRERTTLGVFVLSGIQVGIGFVWLATFRFAGFSNQSR